MHLVYTKMQYFSSFLV